MHPTILKIGPFTVYSYGMMVAIGFAVAVFCMYRRAPKFHIDPNRIIDVCILMLVTGIVGARMLYVIINSGYYMAHPFEIINVSKGGLVLYGGLLSALAALVLYLRAIKLDFWAVMDLIAPYLALAQVFGRIGCFLNGCCYGQASGDGYMFGVKTLSDPVVRHPTQIYAAIALFLIFLILRIWQDRKQFEGEIFLGYCALYSYKRFLIEFMRGDNPRMLFGLTISQVISVIVLVAAVVIFIYKAKQWKRRRSRL
jgi:phosphatidylglycerol:prolipoprotein diacylglycerol transferase